ncbi:TPA: P27 family phage terminase small subunit [Streptococcus suis]|nr:P27 family phage terminase small subunit [Streptococcus suis]HEM3895685.1 P27 family phage terminase small subunit [Streptococcus suis]HEM3903854.1 P27 family phage terminase small subunit [Streptococcus suis]
MEKTIKDLEKQLLSKVAQFSKNKKDAIELEKVRRYMNLVKQYYSLQAEIDSLGLIVETRNASQTFFKENPAIGTQLKISAQLLAIEKSFSFTVDNSPVSQEETEGLV